MKNKDVIREAIFALRKNIPPSKRKSDAEKLQQKFIDLPEFFAAKVVALYVGRDDEVDTRPIIREALRQGKTVILPRVAGGGIEWRAIDNLDELEMGPYNIPQPKITNPTIDVKEAPLLLAPGVAFDLKGGRLGYGKGYYDRSLTGYQGKVAAVAYPCQIIDEIPLDAWDVKVDILLTPDDQKEASHPPSI